MGVALKKLFSGSIAAELNFPYYVQSKQASKQRRTFPFLLLEGALLPARRRKKWEKYHL